MPRPARSRGCTSSSPISRPRARSSPPAVPRSARCATWARPGGSTGSIRPTPTTTPSPSSPIRTATSGCCRNAVMPTALDEDTFEELSRRHRRELHVHCYRMLASFDEAEDAVQETLLRAWRSRNSFDGSTLFRAWLYRIATNVCLDTRRRSSRGVTPMRSFADVPWLQPYPDRLLDEVAPHDDQPDAIVVERETIS